MDKERWSLELSGYKSWRGGDTLFEDLRSGVGLRRGKTRLCGEGWGNGHPPVVISEAWPPVGRPQQCLHRTSQVHKHVTHQEEPRMQDSQ